MVSLPPQPSQSPQSPQSPRVALDTIAMQPRMRGMLFGITESGKSTLAESLIRHWLKQSRARVLIADTKPRFRAEWELSGLPANRRYRRWRRGTTLPGSVLCPMTDPKAELAQVWRLGMRVAIAQDDEAGEEYLLAAQRAMLHQFYRDARDGWPQLAYVDETADFFGTGGQARRGDSLLKIVRAGREKGVAFLGGSQRPKGIPKSLLTEVTQLYVFQLAYPDDLDHIREMGLPPEFTVPAQEHTFAFYSRKSKLYGHFKLGGQQS